MTEHGPALPRRSHMGTGSMPHSLHHYFVSVFKMIRRIRREGISMPQLRQIFLNASLTLYNTECYHNWLQWFTYCVNILFLAAGCMCPLGIAIILVERMYFYGHSCFQSLWYCYWTWWSLAWSCPRWSATRKAWSHTKGEIVNYVTWNCLVCVVAFGSKQSKLCNHILIYFYSAFKKTLRRNLAIVFANTVMLGMCWLIGYFMLIEATKEFFSTIFCIVNSLQVRETIRFIVHIAL